MGYFLVKAQAGEPAPSQMHAQLLHQLPLAGDAVQIPQQQNPQQHFRINRGSPGVAVGVEQLFLDKVETDVTIDEAQQMVFGDLIFNADVVEQRIRAGVLSNHGPRASENGDHKQHHELSFAYNPVLIALASTNSVTFSTATPDHASYIWEANFRVARHSGTIRFLDLQTD